MARTKAGKTNVGLFSRLKVIFYKIYFILFLLPWSFAKFCAAWEEYQKDRNYRERLINFGFAFAYDKFSKSRFEQDYCLKMRLQKEPELKWRIWFMPWTFETPAVIATAFRSGVLSRTRPRRS